MIFEINNELDSVFFNVFKDKEEWVKHEMEDLEGTYDEADGDNYILKFHSNPETVEMGYGEWKILIEGEVIMPKIKKFIKEIDL